MTRKIVDCFIFYNELDMLECRLRELWDVVDVFVLAEGTTTFRGEPKPLYFADNAMRFAPYMDKIKRVAAHLDGNGCWPREHSLRNSMSMRLNGLGLADDDIVVLSDVDEIPDAHTLANEREHGAISVAALGQDFYYYNLTCKAVYRWISARILPWRIAQTMEMQAIRDAAPAMVIGDGGWHFSNFLTPEQMANKYTTGAHEGEFEHFFTDLAAVEKRVSERQDVFGRAQVKFEHVPLSENMYLPREIELFKRFFGAP